MGSRQAECDNKRGTIGGELIVPLLRPVGTGEAVTRWSEFPKGHPLAHDFAEQSVVCYTLCLRCRFKRRCRRGGQERLKRQENRAVLAGANAASAGLVSSADWAYMKAPVPRPHPNLWTKCPEVWPYSRKNSRTAGNPILCLSADYQF